MVDRHTRTFARDVAAVLATDRDAVDVDALEAAVERGDVMAAERLALGAVRGETLEALAAEGELTPLAERYLDIMQASGDSTRGAVRPTGDRTRRALLAYGPVTRDGQLASEANVVAVARQVDGTLVGGQGVVDVTFSRGGTRHAVEVKTVTGGTGRVTMHPTARRRRLAWASRHRTRLHTVVVDARDRFTPAMFSGHETYYRRGVGSFRLSNMIAARDGEHLRSLMSLPSGAYARLVQGLGLR